MWRFAACRVGRTAAAATGWLLYAAWLLACALQASAVPWGTQQHTQHLYMPHHIRYCCPHALLPPPAAEGFQPAYTSPTTGAVYLLNTARTSWAAAREACAARGAQLASWLSLAEQAEAEAGLVAARLLLPQWHQTYWMGLAAAGWPRFAWLAPGAPALSSPGGPVAGTCGGMLLPPCCCAACPPGAGHGLHRSHAF